jgi:hypothetical protein
MIENNKQIVLLLKREGEIDITIIWVMRIFDSTASSAQLIV